MPAYTYKVLRDSKYNNLTIPEIWEIKFEREFVLFYDATGMKQCVNNDSILRIERQNS